MILIKIGDQEYPCEYEDELKCSEETINEDLKNQPSLFAFYAVHQEMAEQELRECKLALEILKAEVEGEIRKKCLEEKVKPTERYLDEQIAINESYIAARIAVDEARRAVGYLRAIKDSFIHRKDMLVTLASNMRAQADPEIFLNKEKYKKAID